MFWRDAPLSVRLVKRNAILIWNLEPWQQPEVLFDVLHYFGPVCLRSGVWAGVVGSGLNMLSLIPVCKSFAYSIRRSKRWYSTGWEKKERLWVWWHMLFFASQMYMLAHMLTMPLHARSKSTPFSWTRQMHIVRVLCLTVSTAPCTPHQNKIMFIIWAMRNIY